VTKKSKSEIVDVDVEVRHETSAAFLLHDGSKSEWFPKSQVENNGDGTFAIPRWLAKQKGFI